LGGHATGAEPGWQSDGAHKARSLAPVSALV